MDETKGHERHGSDHRSDKPDPPKKSKNLADINTNILLFAFNAIGWLLLWAVLWQFSIQFEKFFNKHIKQTHTTIESNTKATEREFDYIKRDQTKLETKVNEIDKAVRGLERVVGGKP